MLAAPASDVALPLLTALLITYCPLPFSASASVAPAAKLSSARDWSVHLLAIVTLQFFALHPRPSVIDAFVLLPLCLVSLHTVARYQSPISKSDAKRKLSKEVDLNETSSLTTVSGWKRLTPWNLIPAAWRPHLRTILHTDSSRKIFYFLLINLAYMGVQLGYGVYTNSLGLISDGDLHHLILHVVTR